MNATTAVVEDAAEPILSPVERVSEMCFGLYMAITFAGAMQVVTPGGGEVRTMVMTALGCNLAWGLVDAVMFLVRTLTERARTLNLAMEVRASPDAQAGRRVVSRALSSVAAQLVSEHEVEAVRARIVAMPVLPDKPQLHGRDAVAAFAIFLIVVAATFPIVLPFVFIPDVATAKWVSRGLALAMLFMGGRSLGIHAGYGGLRTGFSMMGLGAAVIVAIMALGG
jgi:VIT1/CCC1 family predicted Fe2+/Mn2+ transporter